MSARGMGKRPTTYNQRVARIQAFDDIEHQIRDIIHKDQSTRKEIQQEFDGTNKSARAAYRAAVANNKVACKELEAHNRRIASNVSQTKVLSGDRTTQANMSTVLESIAERDDSATTRVKTKDLRDRLIQLVKDLGLTNSASTVSERQSPPTEEQRAQIINFLGDAASNEGYTHTELFNLVFDKARAVGEERQTFQGSIKDLEDQLSAKDTEWQAAVDKLQEEHDDKLDQVTGELDAAKKLIVQNKEQIKNQGNDIKDSKEKVGELERELRPFQQQLANLPEENGMTAKDRLDKAFTSLRALQDSAAKKDGLIKELEGKLTEYEYEDPGDEDVLLRAETNVEASELRQKLDTATKQVKKLEDDKEEQRETIAANNDRIMKLDSEVNESAGRQDRAADLIIAACREAYGKKEVLTWEAVCSTKVLSRLELTLPIGQGREIVGEPCFSFGRNVEAISGMVAEDGDLVLLSWLISIVDGGSAFTYDEHFGNLATLRGIMRRGECKTHLLLFINRYLREVIKLEHPMLKVIGLALYTAAFKMMPHSEAYQLLDMANIVGLSDADRKPSGYLVGTAYLVFLATLYHDDKEAVLESLPTLESSHYFGVKLNQERLAELSQEGSGFIPLLTISIAEPTLNTRYLANGRPKDVWAFMLPGSPSNDTPRAALFYREVAEPTSVEQSALSNRELLFSRESNSVEWQNHDQAKAVLVLQPHPSLSDSTQTFVRLPGSGQLYGPLEEAAEAVRSYFFEIFYVDEYCAAFAQYDSGPTFEMPEDMARFLESLEVGASG